MKNIVFISPPAAGKGTQSNLLSSKYGYYHLSTGDMLRSEIANNTVLGKKIAEVLNQGCLVADDIMIELIKKRLDTIDENKFILDGFPRTLNQAKELDKILDDYVVIYLNVDKSLAMKRICGRLTCSCGRSYNIYEEKHKPKVEGICDSCQNALFKRDDDNEESFNKRFDIFIKNNEEIMHYYKSINKLEIIDVDNDSDDVFKNIEKVII